MYVFMNTVRSEEGTILGTFTNHEAAFTAMIREANPAWKPVYLKVEDMKDLAEEKVMFQRINDLRVNGAAV